MPQNITRKRPNITRVVIMRRLLTTLIPLPGTDTMPRTTAKKLAKLTRTSTARSNN